MPDTIQVVSLRCQMPDAGGEAVTTLAARVAQLRRSGAIITARQSSNPVVVRIVPPLEAISMLAEALQRSIARNRRVIAAAPPFMRGRDERVMARDECGRLKTKSAAGGKR